METFRNVSESFTAFVFSPNNLSVKIDRLGFTLSQISESISKKVNLEETLLISSILHNSIDSIPDEQFQRLKTELETIIKDIIIQTTIAPKNESKRVLMMIRDRINELMKLCRYHRARLEKIQNAYNLETKTETKLISLVTALTDNIIELQGVLDDKAKLKIFFDSEDEWNDFETQISEDVSQTIRDLDTFIEELFSPNET
jgi:hypothetical protein